MPPSEARHWARGSQTKYPHGFEIDAVVSSALVDWVVPSSACAAVGAGARSTLQLAIPNMSIAITICFIAMSIRARRARRAQTVKIAAPQVKPEPKTEDRMRSPGLILPSRRQWSTVSGTVAAVVLP